MKSLGLKENQQLMMMGTVGELKAPEVKTQFVEDMTDAELSKAVEDINVS
jgi:ubiquitin carboxyl-terminal hydrolase 14